MPTQVRGAYPKLLAPGLHKIYVDALETEQRAEEYQAVFNVKTSTSEYEQDLKMAGFGPLQEKPENTPVAYTAMIQGGDKRYIHLTYALAVRTSKELWQDAKYGVINQAPKALARSIRYTKEIVSWNIFNQGFSNNVTTTDGLSLFNNQHPLLGGVAATNTWAALPNLISAAGTFPNRPATDIDLSFTGVQLATTQFERLVDSQGLPINLKPKMVIIAPENRFLARELFSSSGKPATDTNDINSLLGEDLSYMVCHYLTNAGPWFMVTDKKNHSLTVFMRQNPEDEFDEDFDTGAMKQKTTMRMSAGATDWLGTWGSNGA
jgi:hypothetical protein